MLAEWSPHMVLYGPAPSQGSGETWRSPDTWKLVEERCQELEYTGTLLIIDAYVISCTFPKWNRLCPCSAWACSFPQQPSPHAALCLWLLLISRITHSLFPSFSLVFCSQIIVTLTSQVPSCRQRFILEIHHNPGLFGSLNDPCHNIHGWPYHVVSFPKASQDSLVTGSPFKLRASPWIGRMRVLLPLYFLTTLHLQSNQRITPLIL